MKPIQPRPDHRLQATLDTYGLELVDDDQED